MEWAPPLQGRGKKHLRHPSRQVNWEGSPFSGPHTEAGSYSFVKTGYPQPQGIPNQHNNETSRKYEQNYGLHFQFYKSFENSKETPTLALKELLRNPFKSPSLWSVYFIMWRLDRISS